LPVHREDPAVRRDDAAVRRADPPPRPDPTAEVRASIAEVLARFASWARDHAGAACPDAATLGVTSTDAWGHPWRITCTDQPGDQIAGVISAGPDGAPGTADDIASWQLGREVTALVAGPRWTAEPALATPPRTSPPKVVKPPKKRTSGVQLDADGLPVSR
jgi:hypothetical protein